VTLIIVGVEGCDGTNREDKKATGCKLEGGEVIDVALNRALAADERNDGLEIVLDAWKMCKLEQFKDGGATVTCRLPPGFGNDRNVIVSYKGSANGGESKSTAPYPGVSYQGCPAGQGFDATTSACSLCASGKYNTGTSLACAECFQGTFSFEGSTHCTPCPRTGGVMCDGGKLIPQPGFWSPTALPAGNKTERFAEDTKLFECLTCESCEVVDVANGSRVDSVVTPASAFKCAEGYGGVLCAKPVDNCLQQKKKN